MTMTTFLESIERSRFKRRTALYIAAFAIGLLAGHGTLYLLPAAFAFIALLPLARDTKDRWFIPLGYYGAFLITIFPGAALFFGHTFNPIGIAILWLAVAALLSAPWALLCNADELRLSWAVPLCILLEAIPPIGLFAVGNPINATGVLLPHSGWIGLVTVLAFSSLAATRPKFALPLIALMTVVSTTAIQNDRKAPANWTAIDTQLGAQGQGAIDVMADYKTAQYIQRTALETKARVIVFPEDLLQWNNATEMFWNDTLRKLHASHKTMILGAAVLLPGKEGNYRNVAVLRGETNFVYDQRIPIPVTMWKPFGGNSVPMNILGAGTVANVAGERPAILICYEQLLVWPLVRSISEHPTVLIGMANDYWAVKTYFPAIQSTNLKAWGRLFNIPVIAAVNQ
jgi:hypothetical protein